MEKFGLTPFKTENTTGEKNRLEEKEWNGKFFLKGKSSSIFKICCYI